MTSYEMVEIPTEAVAVVRRAVPMAELPAFFGEAFGAVVAAVTAAGGAIVGPPFGWYHGMPSDVVDVAAGFATNVAALPPDGEVALAERPGGRAAVCVHVGPYDTLAATYEALQVWMAEQVLVPRDDMWEEYLSEPTGDPTTWETRIVWPLVEQDPRGAGGPRSR